VAVQPPRMAMVLVRTIFSTSFGRSIFSTSTHASPAPSNGTLAILCSLVYFSCYSICCCERASKTHQLRFFQLFLFEHITFSLQISSGFYVYHNERPFLDNRHSNLFFKLLSNVFFITSLHHILTFLIGVCVPVRVCVQRAVVKVVTRLVGAACPIFYWAIGEALVGECASPLLGNKDGDVDDDNGKNGSSTADACNGSAGTNGSKCLKTKDASNKDAGTDSDNEYLGHLTMIRGGREGSRENWSIGSAKHSKHASGINQVPIGKQGNESRSPRPPKMPQLKFWVLAWIITFNVAGTFLHSNGLPWT